MLGFVRRYWIELVWACFCAANFVVMILWPSWRVIPFHIVWISLTLLYGFRIWAVRTTVIVLAFVMAATALAYGVDDMHDVKLWGELYPLTAAMFLAMVWHARRRVEAQHLAEAQAARSRSLFEGQERFIHDASHELRTPLTIARGHLELLHHRTESSELDVALDELGRIDAIIKHLLLLATADQPDFVSTTEVELEPLLEDVFMRWSEVAPRAWRLGALAPGRLTCDAERLRAALDALLENAVKYSEPGAAIELRARRVGRATVLIEIEDEGCGVPADALERIFERFARADPARTRSAGGVGLGLAIVDVIAKGHGGACMARNTASGSIFGLRLPSFAPAGLPARQSDTFAGTAGWGPPAPAPSEPPLL